MAQRHDSTWSIFGPWSRTSSCEVGLKSAHLAELMHRAGYRAHHFRGGLKQLMRTFVGDDQALRAATSPVLLKSKADAEG